MVAKQLITRRSFIKGAVSTAATITIVPRQVLGGVGYTAPSEQLTKAVIGVNKIEAQLRIGQVSVGKTRRRLTAQQQKRANRYYYRGISYYTNNDFKRAIREWRRVLAIDPGNVKARNNIRKCLAFLRR